VAYRVLDAAQRIIIYEIAGCADDEEVPDALIENNFRRCARIGATDDDRKGVLVLRSFRAASGDRLAGAYFAAGKALVARFQSRESVIS
jgi:hypothetical protein